MAASFEGVSKYCLCLFPCEAERVSRYVLSLSLVLEVGVVGDVYPGIISVCIPEIEGVSRVLSLAAVLEVYTVKDVSRYCCCLHFGN